MSDILRSPLLQPLAMALILAALALLSALAVRAMITRGALDHPGSRSSHERPTPKGGGIGIVVAVLLGMLAGAWLPWCKPMDFGAAAGLWAASLALAIVSYFDDTRNWSFRVKLGAQCLAACLVVGCGFRFSRVGLPGWGALDLAWLGPALTLIWIVFVTNAVNFIDGLNGLASGSVAIAAMFMAVAAFSEGQAYFALTALCLAAGIAGFLPFNFPHARIFMGDVGSQFCGFVIACLGIWLARSGAPAHAALVLPILLAGIFFDVLFTLARRFAAGDPLTEAHRSHLYQIAHRSGMDPRLITPLYWMMVCWSAACLLMSGGMVTISHPLLLLLVPLPEIAWSFFVGSAARRALVGRW